MVGLVLRASKRDLHDDVRALKLLRHRITHRSSLLRAVLVAAIGLVLLCVMASPALALGAWQVTDIPGSFGVRDFVVSDAGDGHIVWSDSRTDIRLYDPVTGATAVISDGQGPVYEPDIDGNDVVWVQVERVAEGEHVLGLHHYAIDTSERTRITGARVAETDASTRPRVKDGKVLWVGAAEAEGAGTDIYLHDLSTNVTRRLTNDARNDWWPETDGTHVVWSAEVGEQRELEEREILLYDIATGRTSSLAVGRNAFGGNPQVDAGRVVWVSTVLNGSEIYLHDIASGVTTQITNNDDWDGVYPAGPQISGGRVVWGARSGRSLDILLYDVGTNVTTRLSNDGGEDRYPSIDGDLIAWFGGDSYDWEVFGYSIASAERFRLTNNHPEDVDAVVADGAIVWAQDEGGWPTLMRAVATQTPAPPVARFPDVALSHPAFSAVQALAAADVVSGRADGGFGPDAPLLRAQAAKIVCEGLDLRPEEEAINLFQDLGADNLESLYPHEYVAIAAEWGIVRGTEPGRFTPWRSVTRAEFVTMVARGARACALGFADAPAGTVTSITTDLINADHRANLLAAESNGLLEAVPGVGAGWDPTAAILRSEAAQVLWNLLEAAEPELWPAG